ncbi:hypothetical protein BDF20DRAFT_309979 [Mycotypha africana]|uniref:uncharacterized protein n=1 Tax=Mycotypha africana TaxID=64632 RepID=UPI002300E8F5|nr:uncharacterized protein BDF20DRAFT_309979 [Mycotypha africana]KAI8988172.1 hypothetical protein BDF20DRAFT_309979 [Mycotypha africana]
MVTNFPLANMSDIIALDPRTSSWSNIEVGGFNIPIGRKHHTTTLHSDGRTLIVIGGEYFNNSGSYLLNDVWTLDTRNTNNYTWSQPPVKGTGFYRSNHTSILINDQIWVIAGTNLSLKAVDIQLLNITDWSWSSSYIPAHVVTLPVAESFSNIGGIKGLIIIIVATVGGTLIASLCVLCWFRKRQAKPSNTAKGDHDAAVLNTMELHTNYNDVQNEDLLKLHEEDQPHLSADNNTSTTKANSKLASLPSMSTNASNSQNTNTYQHRMSTNDWLKQPLQTTSYSMNNISSHPQLQIDYTPYQTTSSPADTETNALESHPNEQYESGNHYFSDRYNSATYHQHMSSLPPMLSFHDQSNNNYNRRSFGFWDAPALQSANFGRESNIMLSPVHRMEDSVGPSYSLDMIHPHLSLQQQHQLQKPNQVDANISAAPVPSPAGSITACASTSSILDESRPSYA